MKKNTLKKIDGTRIRCQYFNGYLIYLLLISSFIPVYFLQFGRQSEIPEMVFLTLKTLSPLWLLSLANRFLFGEIVCVVDEKGIYTDEGFVLWQDFDSLAVDIGICLYTRKGYTRTGMDYSSVILVAEDFKLTIYKAPMYLLRYIKKYKPDVIISLTKGSKFLLVLISTVMIIAYFVVPYLK